MLVPELDKFLRPAEAAERFVRVPQAEQIDVSSAQHLWVGEKFAARALNEIVSAVLGEPPELPTSWQGPMASAG